jgi:cell wall-associated NlpC family hydrolase
MTPRARLLYHPLLLAAMLALVGCATTPDTPRAPHDDRASRIVRHALGLQGVPYRHGKDSPTEGFDCSGFITYVYRSHGVDLPRTTRDMAATLPAVDIAGRRPGDLLFFNTNGASHSHVGLFVGDDRFVHAPSSRTGHVLVSDLNQPYWRRRLTGVRRPLSDKTHLTIRLHPPTTSTRGFP